MMTFGIHTILTDQMIHPATLGPALEERGFGALFLAEHSHIPVHTTTEHAATGGEVPPIYRRVLDPFVALGVVASATGKLLLGTGTSLPIQRDPIQTAKVAQLARAGSGLPVIANGVRPEAALVAAYREAGAGGINFHLPALRTDDALRRLDEFAALLSS